jgi:hypothetical protein
MRVHGVLAVFLEPIGGSFKLIEMGELIWLLNRDTSLSELGLNPQFD